MGSYAGYFLWPLLLAKHSQTAVEGPEKNPCLPQYSPIDPGLALPDLFLALDK